MSSVVSASGVAPGEWLEYELPAAVPIKYAAIYLEPLPAGSTTMELYGSHYNPYDNGAQAAEWAGKDSTDAQANQWYLLTSTTFTSASKTAAFGLHKNWVIMSPTSHCLPYKYYRCVFRQLGGVTTISVMNFHLIIQRDWLVQEGDTKTYGEMLGMTRLMPAAATNANLKTLAYNAYPDTTVTTSNGLVLDEASQEVDVRTWCNEQGIYIRGSGSFHVEDGNAVYDPYRNTETGTQSKGYPGWRSQVLTVNQDNSASFTSSLSDANFYRLMVNYPFAGYTRPANAFVYNAFYVDGNLQQSGATRVPALNGAALTTPNLGQGSNDPAFIITSYSGFALGGGSAAVVSNIPLTPFIGTAAQQLPYTSAGVPQVRTLNLQAAGFDADGSWLGLTTNIQPYIANLAGVDYTVVPTTLTTQFPNATFNPLNNTPSGLSYVANQITLNTTNTAFYQSNSLKESTTVHPFLYMDNYGGIDLAQHVTPANQYGASINLPRTKTISYQVRVYDSSGDAGPWSSKWMNSDSAYLDDWGDGLDDLYLDDYYDENGDNQSFVVGGQYELKYRVGVKMEVPSQGIANTIWGSVVIAIQPDLASSQIEGPSYIKFIYGKSPIIVYETLTNTVDLENKSVTFVCDINLNGIPSAVTNGTMKILYTLRDGGNTPVELESQEFVVSLDETQIAAAEAGGIVVGVTGTISIPESLFGGSVYLYLGAANNLSLSNKVGLYSQPSLINIPELYNATMYEDYAVNLYDADGEGTFVGDRGYYYLGADTMVGGGTLGPFGDLPGVPTISNVAAGNLQATITFTSTNTPTSITYVVVDVNDNVISLGTDIVPGATGGVDEYEVIIAGYNDLDNVSQPFTNGQAYRVKINATNTIGTSEYSAIQTFTPEAPAAPVLVSVTPGNGSLTFVFTQTLTVGTSITGFEFENDNVSVAIVVSGVELPLSVFELDGEGQQIPKSISFTVSDLTNGTTYSNARLRTVTSAAGSSDYVDVLTAENGATPAGTPNAPVIKSFVVGNGSVTFLILTQDSAALNGGQLLDYAFNAIVDGGTAVSLGNATIVSTDADENGAPQSNVTFTGLENGKPYSTVSLNAVANTGNGASTSVEGDIITGTPPSAPSDVTFVSCVKDGSSVSLTMTMVHDPLNAAGTNPESLFYSYSLSDSEYVTLDVSGNSVTYNSYGNVVQFTIPSLASSLLGTSVTVYVKSNTAAGASPSASASATLVAAADKLVVGTHIGEAEVTDIRYNDQIYVRFSIISLPVNGATDTTLQAYIDTVLQSAVLDNGYIYVGPFASLNTLYGVTLNILSNSVVFGDYTSALSDNIAVTPVSAFVAPDAPVITAINGDNQSSCGAAGQTFIVTFNAPASMGGLAFDHYEIVVKNAEDATIATVNNSNGSGPLCVTSSSLAVGVPYTVTMQAFTVNDPIVGALSSALSNAFSVTLTSLPSAAPGLTYAYPSLTNIDSVRMVIRLEDQYNGGAPYTGIEITAEDVSLVAAGTNPSYTALAKFTRVTVIPIADLGSALTNPNAGLADIAFYPVEFEMSTLVPNINEHDLWSSGNPFERTTTFKFKVRSINMNGASSGYSTQKTAQIGFKKAQLYTTAADSVTVNGLDVSFPVHVTSLGGGNSGGAITAVEYTAVDSTTNDYALNDAALFDVNAAAGYQWRSVTSVVNNGSGYPESVTVTNPLRHNSLTLAVLKGVPYYMVLRLKVEDGSNVVYTSLHSSYQYQNGLSGADPAPMSFTMLNGPAAPTSVTALSTDPSQVSLSWTRGLSSIDGVGIKYKIAASSADLATLSDYVEYSPMPSSNIHVVDLSGNPLTPGTTYYVGLSFYDAIGTSSRVTTSFVSIDNPSQPSNLAVTEGDGAVQLLFQVSQLNGDSSINSVLVATRSTAEALADLAVEEHDSIPFTQNGNTLSVSLPSTNGVVKFASIIVTNDSGPSAAYIHPTSFRAATNPSAPTVSVTTGVESGVASFVFGGDDGGYPILSYSFLFEDNTLISILVGDDMKLTDLTNGVSYSVQISAVTAFGSSDSITVEFTPSTLPDGPSSLAFIDQGLGVVLISFTEGDAGGSAVSHQYRIAPLGVDITTLSFITVTQNPFQPPLLNDRTMYTLQMRTSNLNGPSEISTLSLFYTCFLEGTKILCCDPVTKKEDYRVIQSLKKGDLVKTLHDGFMPIHTIAWSRMNNPAHSLRVKNRLYKCSKENYPSLTEDLFLTGCHSILVNDITDDQRAKLIQAQNRVFVTDKLYRLIACVDDRAVPHQAAGEHMVWHFALEHPRPDRNYGVYANGLVVESASINAMTRGTWHIDH
jgi:hypothetical protein